MLVAKAQAGRLSQEPAGHQCFWGASWRRVGLCISMRQFLHILAVLYHCSKQQGLPHAVCSQSHLHSKVFDAAGQHQF